MLLFFNFLYPISWFLFVCLYLSFLYFCPCTLQAFMRPCDVASNISHSETKLVCIHCLPNRRRMVSLCPGILHILLAVLKWFMRNFGKFDVLCLQWRHICAKRYGSRLSSKKTNTSPSNSSSSLQHTLPQSFITKWWIFISALETKMDKFRYSAPPRRLAYAWYSSVSSHFRLFWSSLLAFF